MRLILAAASVAIGSCGPALAWDALGHRSVGYVAERLLQPAALAQVQVLLGPGQGLEAVSTWADDIRGARPETARWHYVNIPIRAQGYDRARDCPADRCVVEAVGVMTRRLADPALAPPARREALMFLVHFIGDMHQPLHAGDNGDRGGNGTHVRLRGDGRKLHEIWDADVVLPLGATPSAVGGGILARLRAMTPAARSALVAGGVVAWANGAQAISREEVYRPLGGGELPAQGGNGAAAPIVLADDYPATRADVASAQLLQAGLRLAALLNATLR